MFSQSAKLMITSALAVTMLTACGGSSSDSTGSTNVDSAPVVEAGSDQTVFESTTVQLDATASDANGDALTYAWTQDSGTAVTLSSTSVSNPTFTAPDITGDETLTFTLTVTAGGATASDSISVTVSDASLPAYAAQFEAESLEGEPTVVSCTVGGASSTCLSVELKSSPGGTYTIGPFCPRLTTDSADEGGIWIQSTDNEVLEVSGNFITTLSTIYDSSWQMFDPATNEVFYTENATECQAAANPTPDASLANHCVECLVEYLDDGLTETYLIPLSPVDAASVNTRTSYGVAFSGALFDQSAPLNLIEGNNNIAPFDDCGGHINPNVGYHIHAVTDGCLVEIANANGHASQIGVALDGYPMFEQLNGTVEPEDLDQCRGHNSDVDTFGLEGVDYHYHVNAPGENAILPCLTGEVAN